MSSPQSSRIAQADFFTTTHRILGQVVAGAKLLCDMLNDRSLSYVMASNVYISRLQEPGEIGAYVPMAYLSKENLTFVIAAAREVRVSTATRLTAQEYKAFVSVPGFEIRGLFLGPHRVDMQTFSPASLDAFVVLRDATAQMVSLPENAFSGEAMLVNRERLESFGLSE